MLNIFSLGFLLVWQNGSKQFSHTKKYTDFVHVLTSQAGLKIFKKRKSDFLLIKQIMEANKAIIQ